MAEDLVGTRPVDAESIPEPIDRERWIPPGCSH